MSYIGLGQAANGGSVGQPKALWCGQQRRPAWRARFKEQRPPGHRPDAKHPETPLETALQRRAMPGTMARCWKHAQTLAPFAADLLKGLVMLGMETSNNPVTGLQGSPDPIAQTAGSIERAIPRIEQRDSAETELLNLRAYLLELLQLIERSPGISAAVDDLYGSACAYVASCHEDGADRGRQRMLREAHLRFRDRLATAVRQPRSSLTIQADLQHSPTARE